MRVCVCVFGYITSQKTMKISSQKSSFRCFSIKERVSGSQAHDLLVLPNTRKVVLRINRCIISNQGNLKVIFHQFKVYTIFFVFNIYYTIHLYSIVPAALLECNCY